MKSKKKRQPSRPGYPLPDYHGHTTDDKHCPSCGSEEITLIGGGLVKSGQQIGICYNCSENFIVDPPGYCTKPVLDL